MRECRICSLGPSSDDEGNLENLGMRHWRAQVLTTNDLRLTNTNLTTPQALLIYSHNNTLLMYYNNTPLSLIPL